MSDDLRPTAARYIAELQARRDDIRRLLNDDDANSFTRYGLRCEAHLLESVIRRLPTIFRGVQAEERYGIEEPDFAEEAA